MGTLLRTLVSRNLKDWDEKLSHAEFAYNRAPSVATGRTPFEVVYGTNPLCPIDLTSLPLDVAASLDAQEKIKVMQKLHEQVKNRIERANEAYKRLANKHRKQTLYKEGDLVWLHLRKERFPQKRKSKLAPRADGPFRITSRVGNNAYKLELPSEYGGVSATFNVGDLSPYVGDEDLADLRANPSQVEENAVNPAKGTEMGAQGSLLSLPSCLFSREHPRTLGSYIVLTITSEGQISSKDAVLEC